MTKNVHTEHCCAKNGCKYGEESNCCVWLGYAKQSYGYWDGYDTYPIPEISEEEFERRRKQAEHNDVSKERKTMIKINNVVDMPVEVYYNGECVGTIDTQYQLNDIRLQVKKQKLSGVYFLFVRPDDVVERIDCDSNGNLSKWPKGFFDVIEKQLRELVGFRVLTKV